MLSTTVRWGLSARLNNHSNFMTYKSMEILIEPPIDEKIRFMTTLISLLSIFFVYEVDAGFTSLCLERGV